jgi:hypothetical protein
LPSAPISELFTWLPDQWKLRQAVPTLSINSFTASGSGQLDVVLRQEHRAGEKTFVDYAGQTVPVMDPKSGEVLEVRQAQVFLAVLGASNYTYAEATWTQNLWDWIHSHVRAAEGTGVGRQRLMSMREAVGEGPIFAGPKDLRIRDSCKVALKQMLRRPSEFERTL